MKRKSLRQLANELGVSHSYLSQVKHGKRPASAKVVSMFNKSKLESGTSNPLGGMNSVFGGFDSHALPPLFCPSILSLSVLRRWANYSIVCSIVKLVRPMV